MKKFIKRTLISIYEQKKIVLENNKGVGLSKTAFQEYVQKNKLGSISYQTLSKSGPDHLPHFRVAALLNGRILSEGEGKSKKEAEAQAAAIALQIVKKS